MNSFLRGSFEFLLILSFQGQVRADDKTIAQQFDHSARATTVALCKAIPTDWLIQLWGGARHAFTADDFATLPPELSGLLHSDGYEQGLQDCFGSNRTAKNAFTMALLFSSSAARLGSLLAGGAVVSGVLRGLRVLSVVFSAAEYYGIARGLKFTALIAEDQILTAAIGLSFLSWVCGPDTACEHKLQKWQMQTQIENLPEQMLEVDLPMMKRMIELATQKFEKDVASLAHSPPAKAQSLQKILENRRLVILNTCHKYKLSVPIVVAEWKSEEEKIKVLTPWLL